MKAVVLEKPGDANALQIKEIPIPMVKPGWVLIKIKAFGINRSELFTRNGDSPSVKLPRILGIECVGTIADPSDSDFKSGQRVVSLMRGLGREFDGSYAEYTLIPSNQVYSIKSKLDWQTFAAIPESYSTAYGSLFDSLQLSYKDILLIRGATSSVGIAAIQLAKSIGCIVIATTRDQNKTAFLKTLNVDYIIVDNGDISDNLYDIVPSGVDKILELVGASTLQNSLSLLKRNGIGCMTGILGGWIINEFEPLVAMRSTTYLTIFESTEVNQELLTKLYAHIEQYDIEPKIAGVFSLDEIQNAHRFMEENKANGKIVIFNKEE